MLRHVATSSHGQHRTSSALRKAQQVIWLQAVTFRLQVFAAKMGGNDYPHTGPGDRNEELPLARLDTRDGLFFCERPSTARCTADSLNTLVGILPIRLVDARDLMSLCHILISPVERRLAALNRL
jgi:hypothetical protein